MIQSLQVIKKEIVCKHIIIIFFIFNISILKYLKNNLKNTVC
jgi:hypothetical protein